MKIRKQIWCLLGAEILILLFWTFRMLIYFQTDQSLGFMLSDWKSDYIDYDDSCGWYTNGENIDVQEEINLLYGPSIPLKKGTYTANIEYRCAQAQHCLVDVGTDQSYAQFPEIVLSEKKNSVSYDFNLQDDVEDFEILIRYNGSGEFLVSNITLAHSSAYFKQGLILLLALFLTTDLCIWRWKAIQEKKTTLVALAGITLLSAMPLLKDGIAFGDDLGFHLLRIEGIARELRCGSFPVHMSSVWLDDFGYPVSVFYGDMLLYFPAVLRLFAVPVVTAYKLYVLAICAGTTVLTYGCMKKILRGNWEGAMLASMAYTTMSYRLTNLYKRAAVGEYSAMMFFPLIALAVYRIYTENVDEWERYKRNAWLLAIGISGLIGTHILSTEMTVIMLCALSIALFKKTVRRNTIKVYLRAAAWTCLLSAYFVVPFLDYYLNVPVNINSRANTVQYHIQAEGVGIGQLFSFFKDVYDNGISLMFLTPGPILMLALLTALLCWLRRRCSNEMKILTAGAVLSLYMASNIFPWDYMEDHWIGGKLLAQIQFPWRYIGIAAVFLTLLFGIFYKQYICGRPYQKYVIGVTAAICVLSVCLYTVDYNGGANMYTAYDEAELHSDRIGKGEYLRFGTDIGTLTGGLYWENIQNVSLVERRGCCVQLFCQAAGEQNMIRLPMFYYKGYHAIDEKKHEFIIEDNAENNQIQFSVPEGYTGNITVAFREPWYWRAAEWISLMALAAGIWLQSRKVRRTV